MNNTAKLSLNRAISEIKKVVKGKDDQIEKIMAAIIAGGHVLIEDIPGVGKTTMAVAFSKAMGLKESRMQFNVDVMPSDITGFNLFDKDNKTMYFKEGPIMCNLFLADELNRTSSRTQAALLEAMEEGQITVDGVSRPILEPFNVIATQNPYGSAGTMLLPMSQLDRFMISLNLGYPELEEEIEVVKSKFINSVETNVNCVIGINELIEIKNEVMEVYISDEVYDYIGRLVKGTRDNGNVALGLSTRGFIAIAKMAKACAYLNGRDYVIPKDVLDIFYDVAKHRIELVKPISNYTEKDNQVRTVLRTIVKSTKKPEI